MYSSSGVFKYKCLERLATYAKIRVSRSRVHSLHIKQEKATTFYLDSLLWLPPLTLFIRTHIQPQSYSEAFPNHVRNIERSILRTVLTYANDIWT
jgi:hypothetical protein